MSLEILDDDIVHKRLKRAAKERKEIKALKNENERLRCALEHIANGCLVPPDGGAPTFDDLIETARKALQGGE